jgi:hypothetical protein
VAQGKAVPGKGAADKSTKSKPATKLSGSNSAKAKTTAEKAKAAQDKRNAQFKPVMLNLNTRKPSPITRAQAAGSQ